MDAYQSGENVAQEGRERGKVGGIIASNWSTMGVSTYSHSLLNSICTGAMMEEMVKHLRRQGHGEAEAGCNERLEGHG